MRAAAIAVVFLVVAFACAAAGQDDDIIFPEKHWEGFNDQFAGISGSLEDHGNNQFAITCFKEFGNCFISSVRQIGPKRLERMQLHLIPIVRWTASEVVAHDEAGPIGCFTDTITLSRGTETALWVREPANRTLSFCDNLDTHIRKWMVDNPPGYKTMFGR